MSAPARVGRPPRTSGHPRDTAVPPRSPAPSPATTSTTTTPPASIGLLKVTRTSVSAGSTSVAPDIGNVDTTTGGTGTVELEALDPTPASSDFPGERRFSRAAAARAASTCAFRSTSSRRALLRRSPPGGADSIQNRKPTNPRRSRPIAPRETSAPERARSGRASAWGRRSRNACWVTRRPRTNRAQSPIGTPSRLPGGRTIASAPAHEGQPVRLQSPQAKRARGHQSGSPHHQQHARPQRRLGGRRIPRLQPGHDFGQGPVEIHAPPVQQHQPGRRPPPTSPPPPGSAPPPATTRPPPP
jgi:hypothetical protein